MNPHLYEPETVMACFDGEIPPEVAVAIRAHLEDCSDCAALTAKFGDVSRKLALWRVAELRTRIDASTVRARTARLAFLQDTLSSMRSYGRVLLVTAGIGAVCLLAFAIAVPNLLKSKMAANEASALGGLRTLNTASVEYANKFGHLPPSLESLREPSAGQPHADAAGLIDSTLASGTKSGYRFVYHPLGDRYTITAEPVEPSKSGSRIFSTDDSGVIFSDGRPLEEDVEHSRRTDRISKEIVQAQPVTMIARAVELSIRVKDFSAARKSLDAVLQRHRGYTAQLTISGDTSSRGSLQATLRIPVSELAAALAELKSFGIVQRESLSGEEVTMQHADLVARISNARETEARLNEILRTRTGKVADVLEVQQQVSQTRGQIEQMEAELKALETRVDFATVTLLISTEAREEVGQLSPSAGTQIRNAFVFGLRDLRDAAVSLTVWLLSVGPTILFWLALLGLPLFWVRRRWRLYHSLHSQI